MNEFTQWSIPLVSLKYLISSLSFIAQFHNVYFIRLHISVTTLRSVAKHKGCSASCSPTHSAIARSWIYNKIHLYVWLFYSPKHEVEEVFHIKVKVLVIITRVVTILDTKIMLIIIMICWWFELLGASFQHHHPFNIALMKNTSLKRGRK